MSVSLISHSKVASPPNNAAEQSMQDLVAYCARVSNPANQNNTQTNEKLIRYLIKTITGRHLKW